MYKLLTRDCFREEVFKRDNYTCVVCKAKGVKLDAHHIIERREFKAPHEFGGYYIQNGASLCSDCHLKAEMTVISCQLLYSLIEVDKPIYPEHLYQDHVYTKWADVILEDGRRTPGPYFYDESVQKILKAGKVLDQYVHYYKYPRSFHHLDSAGVTSDDKVIPNDDHLVGKEIVITIKSDGENTSLYPDYMHARSIDGQHHISRNWVKTFHYTYIAPNLPFGYRICGENLYASHSIFYDNLESYFYGFSMWHQDTCLSWDETLDWFALLDIVPVKEVYRGIYDRKIIQKLFKELDKEKEEGFVVRVTDSFKYSDFSKSLCKLVRPNHVTSNAHWKFKKIIPNKLKENI